MKALSMTWMACVAALLGVLAQARTPQEIYLNIKALDAARHQAVLNMGEALADNNKAILLSETQNVVDRSQDLLAELNDSETVAAFPRSSLAGLRAAVNVVLTDVKIANRILANDLKTQSQKIGALRLVTLGNNKVDPQVAKLDQSQPIILLSEVNAQSAGFQYAGRLVTYAVRVLNDPNGTVTEVTPQIVNPASSLGYFAVDPTPSVPVVSIRKGRGTFTVTMGPNLGGGRVYLEYGGQAVASRLLFNKGARAIMWYDANHLAHSPFDGSYGGAFSGTAQYRDPVTGDPVSMPVAGGVAFTVAGRRILVSQPATGQGTMALTGTSTLHSGVGSLAVPNATVTFHGSLSIARSAAITALGSWSAYFTGGKASGTWSASGP